MNRREFVKNLLGVVGLGFLFPSFLFKEEKSKKFVIKSGLVKVDSTGVGFSYCVYWVDSNDYVKSISEEYVQLYDGDELMLLCKAL